MKLIILMMSLVLATSAFAEGLKESVIATYLQETSLSRENLLHELEKDGASEAKIARKLRKFDKKTADGLAGLQEMTEEEVVAMKDSQDEKSCLFDPGYTFIVTKLTVEDIKYNQENESKGVRAFNKFVGVPVAVGVDIITLPITVLLGFVGPKYCNE